MSRWNHFASRIYERVCFGELAIGDKFRMDKWKGKVRRANIIHVKDSDTTYHELKSKKKGSFLHTAVEVSHYNKKFKL